MPRTLPLALAPQDGEAIDSWLGALAHLYRVNFGILRDRVGITVPYIAWVAHLDATSIANLSTAAAVDTTTIASMTLDRYVGTALANHPTKPLTEQRLVIKYNRSRYCPRCLRASGGRWPLSWRLAWSFACPIHRCLLIDTCPACSKLQRHTWPPSKLRPEPGRCSRTVLDGICGADLCAIDPIELEVDHPFLGSHQTVADMTEHNRAGIGIYRSHPVPARQALADLRYLALAFLSITDPNLIRACTDTSIADLYLSEAEKHGGLLTRDRAFSQSAVAAATAAHVALTIQRGPTLEDAGGHLATLLGDRIAHSKGMLTAVPTISPALNNARIKAYAPRLSAIAQLRYRALSDTPRMPDRISPLPATLAASVPTQFWMPTAWKFHTLDMRLDTVRAALSAAVLLVGSSSELQTVTELLPRHGLRAGRVDTTLSKMRANHSWQDTGTALIRLHDYLDAHPAPIDYTRRRTLSYANLLSDSDWDTACRKAHISTGTRRIELARSWLYELLSGCTAVGGPFHDPELSGPTFQQNYDNFFLAFNPTLFAHLHHAAHQFLRDHSITEPLSWHPPDHLFEGLQLPGAEPDTIDPDALRAAVNTNPTLNAAAKTLGTTPDIVRYRLQTAPPPADAHSRRRYHPHVTAVDLLRLRDQGLSPRQMSTILGVDVTCVYKTARQFNIDVLKRPCRADIDPTWLRQQVINDARSVAEIADTLGLSTKPIRSRITALGIPPPTHVGRECGSFQRPLRIIRALSKPRPDGTPFNDWLRHAVVDDGRSYTAIANEMGVSPHVIVRTAKRLGIPPPVRDHRTGPGGSSRYSAQFRDNAVRQFDALVNSPQYPGRTRAVESIARAMGIAQCTMWKWLRENENQPDDSSSTQRVPADVPALLLRAFKHRGGYHRLQTFVIVARYPTVRAACQQELNISHTAALTQIRALETDLGTKLFVRANAFYPQELTEMGAMIYHAAQQVLAGEKHCGPHSPLL